MSDRRDALTILATGDVFNDLPDEPGAFRHLSPLLAGADIVFGNCEGVYSDQPDLAPTSKVFHGAATVRGSKLAAVPFHVMSYANNHTQDGGRAGLHETLALLRGQGILTTGAGENLEVATRPALVERRGTTVAFLAFCSTFPAGYEARVDRPGLAPLRVRTLYELPDPTFWDPGIQPAIATIPQPEDLALFREAIESARRTADVVVVACHWGYAGMVRDRMSPSGPTHRRVWTDGVQQYEIDLAREAIEHGADAVVCHHQISLRGVAFHHGKPVFHGLGVLVNHFHHGLGGLIGEDDEEFPLYPFEPAYRRTGIAVLDIDAAGEVLAGFIPAQILRDGSTEPLRPDDPRAQEIATHLEALNLESGFATTLERGERDGWMFLRLRPA